MASRVPQGKVRNEEGGGQEEGAGLDSYGRSRESRELSSFQQPQHFGTPRVDLGVPFYWDSFPHFAKASRGKQLLSLLPRHYVPGASRTGVEERGLQAVLILQSRKVFHTDKIARDGLELGVIAYVNHAVICIQEYRARGCVL